MRQDLFPGYIIPCAEELGLLFWICLLALKWPIGISVTHSTTCWPCPSWVCSLCIRSSFFLLQVLYLARVLRFCVPALWDWCPIKKGRACHSARQTPQPHLAPEMPRVVRGHEWRQCGMVLTLDPGSHQSCLRAVNTCTGVPRVESLYNGSRQGPEMLSF